MKMNSLNSIQEEDRLFGPSSPIHPDHNSRWYPLAILLFSCRKNWIKPLKGLIPLPARRTPWYVHSNAYGLNGPQFAPRLHYILPIPQINEKQYTIPKSSSSNIPKETSPEFRLAALIYPNSPKSEYRSLIKWFPPQWPGEHKNTRRYALKS